VEWEAPRQPLFPLVESSLSIIATLYGVRGISRREAVRPIGRMAKGEGRESPFPDAVTATTEKDVTTTEQSIDCVPYGASLSGHSLIV
jgi:hypothetical protein